MPSAVTEPRDRQTVESPAAPRQGGRPGNWSLVSGIEVAVAAGAVILDLGIPTFVILALMVLSLLIRRQGLSTMGFHRVPRARAFTAKMLAFAAGWTLLNVGLLKPIENHLTGTTQDVSQFMALRGNLAMLLTWIALSWTVAAVGETLAFIGFILTRITDVIGSTGARLAIAVVCCPRSCSACCTPNTESWASWSARGTGSSTPSCATATRPCGRRSWRTGSSTPSASSASSSSGRSTASGELRCEPTLRR
jgi:hypothetical protein